MVPVAARAVPPPWHPAFEAPAVVSAINYVHTIIFPAAFALLPAKMDSLRARAMLLAIGLQESRFLYRHQVQGPAGGFWQFEEAGVAGILRHGSSAELSWGIAEAMGYQRSVAMLQDALDDNDVLACAYARLLLWTSARGLPAKTESRAAWSLYLDCWRPGKPHPATWDPFFAQAWAAVEGR